MIGWKDLATPILVAALAAFYTGGEIEMAIMSDGTIAFGITY